MGKFSETIHFIIFIKLFFINYPYLGTEDEENCCKSLCPCFYSKNNINDEEEKNNENNLIEENEKLEEKKKNLEEEKNESKQEKENNFNNRENELNRKEERLNKKDEELNLKENGLNKRGEDINIKEEQLEKKDEEFNIKFKGQEDFINEKNKELSEKNEFLINNENSLKQKELELEKKDEELKIKQTGLEEKQSKFEKDKSEFDKRKLEFEKGKKKYEEENKEEENANNKNLDNNIHKPEDINNNDLHPVMQVNNIGNDYNNDHINENENVMQNDIKNSLNDNPNNNNKTFTNRGQKVDTGDIVKSNMNQENNNNNIINENNGMIEEEPKEVDYSFDCTNAMYLTAYIYEGTNEAKLDIILNNNGKKTWPNDTKLKIIEPSDFELDDIDLKSQRPEEERTYYIKFKNLKDYKPGIYQTNLAFYCNGEIYGEKLVARLKINKLNDSNKEIEENLDKINEFRSTFDLSKDEYPDERILSILQENDFNFEKAFSFIFGPN